MYHWILALRELFTFSNASWKARWIHATIRFAKIKPLRWGSPEIVRKVVDNKTPVQLDPVVQIPELTITRTELDPALYNCPVFDIRPSGRDYKGTIVYLHGGAYIHQPGLKQWTAVKKLAADYGCRVVLPIYPKGPKYTFKDAYPPMLRLLERTAAECANGKYLLMGDSAGGGLCIGLCLAIRDQGKDFMPTELVLSSPWTDISMSTPELEEQSDKDPWLNLSGLLEASHMWTGYQAEELKNPLASPVYGDFTHGIPKISMSIGTRELLYYDQLRFWEKLKEQSQGKSCGHLIIGKDMVHVYGILGDMPETVEPWQDIAAAVERLVQQS